VGKEGRGQEVASLRQTASCKFPTKQIMGAQHFNFYSKFPRNRGFSTPNFVFLEEIFGQAKIGGNSISPLARRRWLTLDPKQNNQRYEQGCDTGCEMGKLLDGACRDEIKPRAVMMLLLLLLLLLRGVDCQAVVRDARAAYSLPAGANGVPILGDKQGLITYFFLQINHWGQLGDPFFGVWSNLNKLRTPDQ